MLRRPRATAATSLVLAAALVAAGCGGSTTNTAAGTGTSTATSTTVAVSGQAGNAGGVGAAAAAAGSAAASTTASTAAPATSAATSPAATGATTAFSISEQSNCTPSTDTLPDGVYFGYISEIMDDVLLFDLACWFTGAPAAKAAKEDRQESPPPNDYYIRNTSTKVRNVVVGPKVSVALLPNPGSPNTITATYQEWGIARGTGYQPPIWITIQGGVLTRVVEQFLP